MTVKLWLLALAVLLAQDSRPDKGGAFNNDEWDTNVPFETAPPRRVARMTRTTGMIHINTDRVMLTSRAGTEHLLVLPAVPDLAWNAASRQLRLHGAVLSDGDIVSLGGRRNAPPDKFYPDINDDNPVWMAKSVYPAELPERMVFETVRKTWPA